ncbi:hypothetical protein FQA47_012806, partial [Oryzias melastigma]
MMCRSHTVGGPKQQYLKSETLHEKIVLKMDLQQLGCRFTLLTLLLCSGCPAAVVT